MTKSEWVAAGALLCGLGVVAGAFGSHALEDRLAADLQLENWRTAVRYGVWHGLALLALAPSVESLRLGRWTLALFAIGSVCFSGSILLLALGGPGAVLGPITPVGGGLLIVGWARVVWAALRSRS